MTDKALIKLLLRVIELQELELKVVRDNWNKKLGKLEEELNEYQSTRKRKPTSRKLRRSNKTERHSVQRADTKAQEHLRAEAKKV